MNDSDYAIIGTFIVGAVIVFLVFREFFCWYWKINQRVALLTQIRDQLNGNHSSSAFVVHTRESSSPPPKGEDGFDLPGL